ncbi:MAG: YjdF family protein [Lawsonibacter sp.]|nr:YjdF family protein [Lawsonibacter sp.]
MDRNFCCFTVLFQPPFWVGIAERWEESGYSAAKVTFGPEPTDAQLYQWIQKEWYRLKFSPAAEGERPATERKNPKRAQREAREATRQQGVSTRAQQALSRQREQEGLARKREAKGREEQRRQEKYLLRQQKKREKKRGR